MKNKPIIITLIVLLSILLISLTIGFIYVLKNPKIISSFKNNKMSSKKILDEEFENNFELIDIESEYGNIEIKESDTDRFKLVVYSEGKATFTNNDSTLKVKATSKTCDFLCFNFNVNKDRIIVYLPKDYSKNMDIKSNYGDIKIEKFKDMNLLVESDYGDIHIESIGAADLYFDYGDIEIDEVVNKLNIESDYGDVEIKKLFITENSKIEADYGDIEIGTTNEIYINAITDLGDVKINNNYRKADLRLTINVDLGDIKVKN